MKTVVLSLSILLTLILGSCTEETINHITNVGSEGSYGGHISGRILSASVPISVSIWQGGMIQSTIADDSGYYRIRDIEPGQYSVHVENLDTAITLGIFSIYEDSTRLLGTFSLPGSSSAPLSVIHTERYYSGDFPPTTSSRLLVLYFDKPVSLSSLATAITMSPAIELNLELRSQYGYYNDIGIPQSRLDVRLASDPIPGEAYTLTVSSSLESTDGSTLVSAKQYNIRFQKLAIERFSVSGSSYYSQSALWLEPGEQFLSEVWLNSNVDPVAFSQAASFSPAIPGSWILSRSNQYPNSTSNLRFFPSELPNLLPNQTYRFTVDGDVPLINNVSLEQDYSIEFYTRPVRVTGANPQDGSRSQRTYADITVYFNTPMERSSTELAFRLSNSIDQPVSGSISWSSDSKRLTLNPSSDLATGAYVITVGASAKSQSGHNIKDKFSSLFSVGF